MSTATKSRRAAAAAPRPRTTANTSIISPNRRARTERGRRQVDAFRNTGRVNNRRLSEEERIAIEIAAIEAQYARQDQAQQQQLSSQQLQAVPATQQKQTFVHPHPNPHPSVAPASATPPPSTPTPTFSRRAAPASLTHTPTPTADEDSDSESEFSNAPELSSDEESEYESQHPPTPPQHSRKKVIACKTNKRTANPNFETSSPPKRTKVTTGKTNKRPASSGYENPAPTKRQKVTATTEVEVSTLRQRTLQELEDPTIFWNAITHIDSNLPKRRRAEKGLYNENSGPQEAREEREEREKHKQRSEENRIKRAQRAADETAKISAELADHADLRNTKLQEDDKAILVLEGGFDETLNFNGPFTPQTNESQIYTPTTSPEPSPKTIGPQEQKKAARPVCTHSVLAHYTKEELIKLLSHIDEEESKKVMASLASPSHKVVEMKLNISSKAANQAKIESLVKGKQPASHKQRNVEKVVFGDVAFPAWFPSEYPGEIVAAGKVMYLCAKCFLYHSDAQTAVKHRRVCKRHIRGESVPGEKIYQHGSHPYSVWRVRGDDDVNKLYLQGLSLFAKMFIDSKTVMFDIVNFDYYLLVHTSSEGDQQVIGYYSKQRQAWEEYNLACVMIFPPWQQKGLGSILTNLAYEIGIKQGLRGGPERPISDVGHKGYMKVWGDKICPYLLDLPDTDSKKGTGKIDVDRIHQGTGVSVMDILDFLVTMGEQQGPNMPKFVFMKKNGHHVKRDDADWNKSESLFANADGTLYHLIIDKEDIRAWMDKHDLGRAENIDKEMIDFPAALKI